MKIKSIRIWDKDSKLNEFEWKSNMPINIIIGENGSGKTTILKNLISIFSAAYDLYIPTKKSYFAPQFDFEIIYDILIPNQEEFSFESNYVEIKLYSTPLGKNFCDFESANTKYSKNELIKKFGYESILPSNLIAYYAGWDDKIKTIFKDKEEYYKSIFLDINIKRNNKKIVNPFLQDLNLIYIEKIHFQILLSCLFAFEYNSNLDKYLEEKFNISKTSIAPINILIKKPNDSFYNSNHESFWGARGEIRIFLDILKSLCIEGNFIYNKTNDTITFSYNLSDWYKLREFYTTEKRLYFYMHLLNSSGFLAGIQTFFTKDDKMISNHNLSEGEQQLLTILGIKEVLMEQNSIILLDEPDTFLHPKWQHDFIKEIAKDLEYPKGGDFLPFHNEPNIFITSHSLNLLNNANKDLVKITLLENGRESDRDLEFYGKTIASVNYNLMGLTERPIEIQEKIYNLFRLLELEQIRESEILFEELSEIIGTNDEDLIRAKVEIDFLKSIENDKN